MTSHLFMPQEIRDPRDPRRRTPTGDLRMPKFVKFDPRDPGEDLDEIFWEGSRQCLTIRFLRMLTADVVFYVKILGTSSHIDVRRRRSSPSGACTQ